MSNILVEEPREAKHAYDQTDDRSTEIKDSFRSSGHPISSHSLFNKVVNAMKTRNFDIKKLAGESGIEEALLYDILSGTYEDSVKSKEAMQNLLEILEGTKSKDKKEDNLLEDLGEGAIIAKEKDRPSALVSKLLAEMHKKGVNARELAEQAGVGKSFVYDILNGKSTNPTTLKLLKIANTLKIPLNFLVDFKTTSAFADEAPLNRIHYLDPDDYPNKDAIAFVLKMPFALSTERTASLRLHQINSDNMEPTLNRRDIVLVDLSLRTPYPSGIFVIKNRLGLFSLYRIEYSIEGVGVEKSTVKLISDNSKYQLHQCPEDEVEIVGRVIFLALRQI